MENSLQTYLNILEQAPKTEKQRAFLEYCRKNIELVKTKVQSEQEASYNMCGACNSFFDDLMPEYSELMNLVCDIEIPTYIMQADEKKWSRVKEIVSDTKE